MKMHFQRGSDFVLLAIVLPAQAHATAPAARLALAALGLAVLALQFALESRARRDCARALAAQLEAGDRPHAALLADAVAADALTRHVARLHGAAQAADRGAVTLTATNASVASAFTRVVEQSARQAVSVGEIDDAARGLAASAATQRELGIAICVAVVDRGGLPLAFLRMPASPLQSIDIAGDKAYTAVSFGRPTADWEARLAERSAMLRHGLIVRARFAGFGGGLAVEVDGVRVGGVGVSGGSEAQDEACCRAGLATLGE